MKGAWLFRALTKPRVVHIDRIPPRTKRKKKDWRCSTPQGRAWMKGYNALPERRAYQKMMNAQPHIKAQKRKYNQDPENKRRARFRELLRDNGMSIGMYMVLTSG